MANIQQAAKWMQEGKRVVRRAFTFVLVPPEIDGDLDYDLAHAFGIFTIECEDGGRHDLSWHDLLADDWELDD